MHANLSQSNPSRSSGRLLVPGRNCWRIERAGRFATIVDAAEYFSAVKSSILKARRSVLLIGFDFDTRIRLDPEGRRTSGPDKLGKFLSWVVEQRPELEVFVLKWDLGMINTFGRGSTPLRVLDWITSRRMHFKLDGAHPVGSAHHQKIVVIDDAVAFCGGIDITAERWDTRDHLDDNPRRRRPTTGRRYGPWHDATTAVDGKAALALGLLARERWKRATGEDLPPPAPQGDPWPEDISPTFTDVDVAIARTVPAMADRKEIREIEALYLSAIGQARRTIYIESQYFAARRIAEAMAERLREPDGPEIVIVNPASAYGWLEEEAMGSARARLFKLLKDSDSHDRFRIYNPYTEGGEAIYVHAKIMVIDDWLLRVGSSNLNNRSLGYDTECDLAVEVLPGPHEDSMRRRITDFRDDLLAEHLGVNPAAVSDALRQGKGSLIGTVERLRTQGRSLRPFTPPDFGAFGEALAETDLLDPETAAPRLPSVWRWLDAAKRHVPGLGGS
jgi:phospholipase D1/2